MDAKKLKTIHTEGTVVLVLIEGLALSTLESTSKYRQKTELCVSAYIKYCNLNPSLAPKM